ncbi:DinB family protein [Shouchella miscanthi]|uniref:DinB family protein n=1 Tax=Shouchella miscanthi TaxID=2598861 RepID=UPI00119E40A7|nr:DinB family protein [Shouchella miscanthi]
MNNYKVQYDLVRRSRDLLFTYCESMKPSDYLKKVERLGEHSIPSLHCHVSDAYRIWIGKRALGKSVEKTPPQKITSVEQMRKVFHKTDEIVYEFLENFTADWNQASQDTWNSNSAELTELWLFTHTVTHEFHHRGQIVKIGQQLGYKPPKLILPKPIKKENWNLE